MLDKQQTEQLLEALGNVSVRDVSARLYEDDMQLLYALLRKHADRRHLGDGDEQDLLYFSRVFNTDTQAHQCASVLRAA